MSVFLEPVSEIIWDLKYRYRKGDVVVDETVQDTWLRVAKAVAKAEKLKERKHWEKKFYSLLEDFNFLPGGRILAGAGTTNQVTLFNCFVMEIEHDSIEAIFNALKEGALTLQEGGGVGYDFSVLRPKGQPALKTGSIASGPISFMRIWDSMSATMQSSGARRGAMMGTLRCDHPDIEEFINIKSHVKELRHFNISVLVTDAFMQAVQSNSDWKLVFPVDHKSSRVVRVVKATELWKKIIKAAYDYAEPGVLFIDTINRLNTLYYQENISATNPCGEIPLPVYGACNLGSLNLVKWVEKPFSKFAAFNWEKLENSTQLATRFLDNVISISKFPLEKQRAVALTSRRIGLGFTGLADALCLLGLRYGETASLEFAKDVMQRIAAVTWETSIELGKEKGSFLTLKKQAYLQGEFVKNLPENIQQKIKKFGLRNSHHNAIAPTGTISLLANNISNGLEPIFSAKYKRSVRHANGDSIDYLVRDYAYRLWQKTGHSDLPPAWVDSEELNPEAHLQMQAALQPFIDNAISKTINLPENYPFKKVVDVYTKAYNLGLKGCTIFRPNAITGSILSISDVDRCCPAK